MSLDIAKKHLLDLNKVALDVVKRSGLEGVKAQVDLVIDVSGSMESNYRSGAVQETSDRILALAMEFDINKEIDVFAFDNQSRFVGSVGEDNFYGFVAKKVAPLVGGGTSYAPAMKAVLEHHGFYSTVTKTKEKKGFFGGIFGSKEVTKSTTTETFDPAKEPVLVIFVTDGDNFDKAEAEQVIRESSKHGVFWKFVGIGREHFSFLKKLDMMEGRVVDNANFQEINDIAGISEKVLYEQLLEEFPDWLKEARSKGIIQ